MQSLWPRTLLPMYRWLIADRSLGLLYRTVEATSTAELVPIAHLIVTALLKQLICSTALLGTMVNSSSVCSVVLPLVFFVQL